MIHFHTFRSPFIQTYAQETSKKFIWNLKKKSWNFSANAQAPLFKVGTFEVAPRGGDVGNFSTPGADYASVLKSGTTKLNV